MQKVSEICYKLVKYKPWRTVQKFFAKTAERTAKVQNS